jgi:hypothetical protein
MIRRQDRGVSHTMTGDLYRCPACGEPIPRPSFRVDSPFHPRRCPGCGTDRWPEWYARRVRQSRYALLAYAVVIAAFAMWIVLAAPCGS